jgi:hypothetical protein
MTKHIIHPIVINTMKELQISITPGNIGRIASLTDHS